MRGTSGAAQSKKYARILRSCTQSNLVVSLAPNGALSMAEPPRMAAAVGSTRPACEKLYVATPAVDRTAMREVPVTTRWGMGTALVIAAMFGLCLLFAPLAQSVPAFASSAALLFVASVMARGLADLDWSDATESSPGVIVALAMPMAFSIADGIGIGFIAYALIKVAAGRWRECPGAVYLVAAIFALKFAFL